MPLGGFGLLSFFYIFLGLRFLYQAIPHRKEIFDDNFTPHDRSMLGQAAFYVLLPASVALHELGHAIAIWAMGGQVLGFGFYFFSGYVSYDPTNFSDVQQTLIAFAGTFVNLLLIVIALAVVFLKRPPLRPPWNELLLQFVFISGINALIFYPALDLITGMSGDWSQMYQSGVPWLTAVIVAIQASFIAIGWWGMHNPGIRARIATLTGLPQGSNMRLAFGGGGNQSQPVQQIRVDASSQTGPDRTVSNAINRVAAGWSTPTATRLDRGQGGTVTSMLWQSNNGDRAIAVILRRDGDAALVGNVHSRRDPAAPANQSTIRTWSWLPSEDELTMAIRVGAEQVDAWPIIPQPSRA